MSLLQNTHAKCIITELNTQCYCSDKQNTTENRNRLARVGRKLHAPAAMFVLNANRVGHRRTSTALCRPKRDRGIGQAEALVAPVVSSDAMRWTTHVLPPHVVPSLQSAKSLTFLCHLVNVSC